MIPSIVAREFPCLYGCEHGIQRSHCPCYYRDRATRACQAVMDAANARAERAESLLREARNYVPRTLRSYRSRRDASTPDSECGVIKRPNPLRAKIDAALQGGETIHPQKGTP